MARDASGIYSLPPGYLAQTGQTILASQHNPPLEDIAQALTGSLPRNGAAPMLGDLSMASFKVKNVGPGTAGTDAVNRTQLLAAGSPVGSVVDFAGAVIPVGWLLCYGQEVSRATYADLFAVLGTTFGSGDNATTFNVPDCRGRVTAGNDAMGGASAGRISGWYGSAAVTVGGAFGSANYSLNISQMPAHDHGGTTQAAGAYNFTVPSYLTSWEAISSTPGNSLSVATTYSVAIPAHVHGILSQGSGTPFGIAQPTIVFNKIIKASNAG